MLYSSILNKNAYWCIKRLSDIEYCSHFEIYVHFMFPVFECSRFSPPQLYKYRVLNNNQMVLLPKCSSACEIRFQERGCINHYFFIYLLYFFTKNVSWYRIWWVKNLFSFECAQLLFEKFSRNFSNSILYIL